jgi:hypothetical protein
MSIMFSSPGFISMLAMGIILFVTLFGSIGWAIYHVASGKFHEEYEVATVVKEGNNKA